MKFGMLLIVFSVHLGKFGREDWEKESETTNGRELCLRFPATKDLCCFILSVIHDEDVRGGTRQWNKNSAMEQNYPLSLSMFRLIVVWIILCFVVWIISMTVCLACLLFHSSYSIAFIDLRFILFILIWTTMTLYSSFVAFLSPYLLIHMVNLAGYLTHNS